MGVILVNVGTYNENVQLMIISMVLKYSIVFLVLNPQPREQWKATDEVGKSPLVCTYCMYDCTVWMHYLSHVTSFYKQWLLNGPGSAQLNMGFL
jgi:hypothetical protein